MRRLLLLILIFVCFNFPSFSQEMMGISNGNYAGVYNISINPANMTNSRLYLDFNILAAGNFFENNYVYLERSDYFDLLFDKRLPVYVNSDQEERNFKIYYSDQDKYGIQSVKIHGPGGMMLYGKHAFAITTSFREVTSFRNLPYDIANFLYEAIDYSDQHNINYVHDKEKIQVGSLSWSEIGFSYAYQVKRKRWESWSIGVTLKPLFGTTAFFANVYNVDYTVHDYDSASIYNVSFDYGYSLPVNYSTSYYPEGPMIRGFGAGMDIGVVYQKTTQGHSNGYFSKLCAQHYDKYNYRIGVSLLDLGFIRFNKKAEKWSYENAGTVWYKPDDTLDVASIDDINRKIQSFFLRSAEYKNFEQEFVVNTPPAVSVQLDIPIRKDFFLNSNVTVGFNIGNTYVKRPSFIAFTPRYETSNLEINIPVAIVEWEVLKPRIGVSVRYGPVFVGVDKINNLFSTNISGFEYYAGLRFNLFENLGFSFIKGRCDKSRPRNIETFDYRNF